jgi:3-phenylpropionate/cinnamic acid dioxygenase small subunit
MDRTVEDHLEISDLLARYGIALDIRDWELLATCFAPELRAVYAETGTFESYEAWEQMARGALDRCASTQHLIGNVRITVSGDTANAQSYAQAAHVMHSGELAITGTAYTDVLRRTDAGWRITSRNMVRLWGRGPHQIADVAGD